MIIHLINMIDRTQAGRLETQWQGWLRGSMMCWLGGRGDLADARSDYGYINEDLSIKVGEHVLELSSKVGEDIPLLLYSHPSYTKQIVHIFFAGVSGWQLIQRNRWNRNMRLHWIGEQLPLTWPLSRTKCTAYVPEYALIGHTIFGNHATSRLVVLPYMPAMNALIGSAQIRHINLLAESRARLEEKKSKAVPVYLLGECHEEAEKLGQNALYDHEIAVLLPVIDQCVEANIQPLNPTALGQIQLGNMRKTSLNRQSYTLSRWLHSKRVEPEEDIDRAIHEEDIIATITDKSTRLAHLDQAMHQERTHPLTKHSLKVYPDLYHHSVLSQASLAWQMRRFFEDKASYLLVPSTDKACLSALVSENIYQACRNRIWVVLKAHESAGSFSWVWRCHEQGFFHAVILDEQVPFTSVASPDLAPEPMNSARVCWQAWKEDAQKELEQEKIGSGGFFAKLTSCLGHRRLQTHPEEAIIYPRVN